MNNLIALFVLIVTLLGANGNVTQSQLGKDERIITGVRWTRNIEVLAYQQVQESSWDSVPAGAVDVTTRMESQTITRTEYARQEVVKSRQVMVGTVTKYRFEDMGNGTLQQVPYEEPIYETQEYTDYETVPVSVPYTIPATKYYYTIWRWAPTRIETASGKDQVPYWPDIYLGNEEMEGARTEIYGFTVMNAEGASSTYRIADSSHAEKDWENLSVGMIVKIPEDNIVTDPSDHKLADIIAENQ